MTRKETTIINKTGLHARPAAGFVQAASRFGSDIKIRKAGEADGGDEQANAKSIVLLLSLGLNQGDKVEVTAAGADEKEAVDSLIALIDSGFGE